MDLKHKLDETSMALNQTKKIKDELQKKCVRFEQDFTRIKQDNTLKKVGLNIHDSRLAVLVTELKKRIKQLESEKRDGKLIQQDESAVTLYTEVDGVLVGQSLFALREEYCTKLEKLAE